MLLGESRGIFNRNRMLRNAFDGLQDSADGLSVWTASTTTVVTECGLVIAEGSDVRTEKCRISCPYQVTCGLRNVMSHWPDARIENGMHGRSDAWIVKWFISWSDVRIETRMMQMFGMMSQG